MNVQRDRFNMAAVNSRSHGDITKFFKSATKYPTSHDSVDDKSVGAVSHCNSSKTDTRTTKKRKLRKIYHDDDDEEFQESIANAFNKRKITLKRESSCAVSRRQTRSCSTAKNQIQPEENRVNDDLFSNMNVSIEERCLDESVLACDIAAVIESILKSVDNDTKQKTCFISQVKMKSDEADCKIIIDVAGNSPEKCMKCPKKKSFSKKKESKSKKKTMVVISSDEDEDPKRRSKRVVALGNDTIEDDECWKTSEGHKRSGSRTKTILKNTFSKSIDEIHSTSNNRASPILMGIMKYFSATSKLSVTRSNGSNVVTETKEVVMLPKKPIKSGSLKSENIPGLDSSGKRSKTEVRIVKDNAKNKKFPNNDSEVKIRKKNGATKVHESQEKKVISLRRSPRFKNIIEKTRMTSIRDDFYEEPSSRKKSLKKVTSRTKRMISNRDDLNVKYKVSMLKNPCGQRSLIMRITRSNDGIVKAKQLLNKAKKSNHLRTVEERELAPVFTKKKTSNKCSLKLDAKMLRLRRKFLMSGIPETLQQQIADAKAQSELIGNGWFSTIGHISAGISDVCNQNLTNLTLKTLLEYDGSFKVDSDWRLGEMSTINWINFEKEKLKNLKITTLSEKISKEEISVCLNRLIRDNNSINVKTIYDSYVFRRLKRKTVDENVSMEREMEICIDIFDSDDETVVSEAPSSSNSSDFGEVKHGLLEHSFSFHPESHHQVVGNVDAVKRLRTWLCNWMKDNSKETVIKRRRRVLRRKNRISSDESNDDDKFFSSDTDDDVNCNTVLLVGPLGCGKTCSVYALANELGFKVLEVNSSSRRSGKIVLERLREATQSHQVVDAKLSKGQPDSKSSTKIHSFFKETSNKKKRASKIVNKIQSKSQSLSLILLEDVDIVFNNDDGFWSAVNTFMTTAKRPIILTSNDSRFSQRGRLRGNYEEINYDAPDVNEQTVHLQLMRLAAESRIVSDEQIRSIVLRNDCDFRRCILSMHFMDDSTNKVMRPEVLYKNLQSIIKSGDSKGSKEENEILTSLLENWCAFDRITVIDGRRRELVPVMRDMDLMAGLDDVLPVIIEENEDCCVDALTSDIMDYYGHKIVENFKKVWNGYGELDNIEWTTESFLTTERRHCENLEMIKMIAERVQPFYRCTLSTISMDYLPSLRDICRAEQGKTSVNERRRYSNYLSSTSLCLNPEIILKLSQTFKPPSLDNSNFIKL